MENIIYNTNPREEALYYISLGLPIIPLCPPQHQGMNQAHCSPCNSPGKVPLLKEWVKWSVTTKDNIIQWFKTNPYINIGLPLGQISGIIGVDIDGREGEVVLLAMSNGDIPETWEFNTGEGRRLLYAIPKGFATKKVTVTGTAKHQEMSLLGDGQQTVMPPSTHSTGRKYIWKQGFSPRDIPIARAPKWILDKIKATDSDGNAKSSTPITTDDWQRTLHEGERNVEMTRRAGSLIGRGLPKEQVMEFLEIWNNNYCSPPLELETISTIVESIYLREQMQKSKKGRENTEEDKPAFKPTPFARQFLFQQKELGFIWKYSTEMGAFFRCDETTGPWVMLDLDYVKSEIRKSLINQDKGGHTKWDGVHYIIESVEALKSELVLPKEENIFDIGFSTISRTWELNPLDIIVLRNGIFEYKTNELHPWNSKIYTTIQLPVDYDPNAECPFWEKALRDWIPDENTILFLQEYAGLCLIPDTSFRIAVFLYGTGSNGKSMFLDAVRMLFGDGLVSIPLHRLSNRFETAYLQNKLVNICGDIDSKYISDTGVLKSIISGDSLRGEIKHGKAFDFVPVCRLMFSANNLPNVADKSVGWISRWKFVEFPHTFPVNPSYKIQHTIMFEKEKSGILNWAIKGLQRLKVENSWTYSKTMEQSANEYRAQNDNVSAFVDECLIKDEGNPDSYLVSGALHKTYSEWIDNALSGTQPVAIIEFSKRLSGMGFTKGVKGIDVNKTSRVFFGVKIKDQYKRDYEHWANLSRKELF